MMRIMGQGGCTTEGAPRAERTLPHCCWPERSRTAERQFIAAVRDNDDGNASCRLITHESRNEVSECQPACQTDATNGTLDCSNWSVSASWTVPDYREPGMYYALLRRADNRGVNHIPFVVSAV